MQKIEYFIFNFSTLQEPGNRLGQSLKSALTKLGEDGFIFATKINDTSWLFYRPLPLPAQSVSLAQPSQS